jgi:hypothetical protein
LLSAVYETFSGFTVRFQLAIPLGGIKFHKPGAKNGQFAGAELSYALLKYFDL